MGSEMCIRDRNVGQPKDVIWQGRTVHTAVWKDPVDGPQLARRLNIDGDGQGDLAGHGGEQRAVFVYQIESYRYWQDYLSRDDFSYGQFGENLTVQGLADDEVCIGDRYQIGSAVCEVSQPRVTCYRVGIRMDDARMPALLISHHRPGFYFRVLREGTVQAGDDIVLVARGPEAMTVADVDALLYLPGHSHDQISRALLIPALSPGWKLSFEAILSQGAGLDATGNAGLTAVSPPPAWAGFRPLNVTDIEPESESVISVYLADPDGTGVPPAQPGQFLTLRLPTDQGRKSILRSYSLSGAPGASTYRVSVKREPHGVGSQFVHDRVRRGDRLDVAAPRGHLCPAVVRRAGPFAERRSGCDAGAGDAPCAGRHPVQPRCLVAAWRPQSGRGALRNRVTVAARGTAQRPPICLLQPPQTWRCCWTRLPEGWAPHCIGPGHTRPAP